MNCTQCLAAGAGFLEAYWLTLAVSACVAGAAALFLAWQVRSGEWAALEEGKSEMLEKED